MRQGENNMRTNLHLKWTVNMLFSVGTRDLTQMRTGGQKTAFEIHNCRKATIESYYLLLSGQNRA